MKRITILVAVLVAALFSTAQTHKQGLGAVKSTVQVNGGLKVDSLFTLPNGDTVSTVFTPLPGSLQYWPELKSIWYHDGTGWRTWTNQVYVDTLYNRGDSLFMVKSGKEQFLFAEKDPLFDQKFAGKSSDDLAEGATNLYFTQARARASLQAGPGINYNSTTGVISAVNTSGGSVTSVGLIMPSGFTVSGNPITSAGTFVVGTPLKGILQAKNGGIAPIIVGDGLSFANDTLKAVFPALPANVDTSGRTYYVVNGLSMRNDSTMQLGGYLDQHTRIKGHNTHFMQLDSLSGFYVGARTEDYQTNLVLQGDTYSVTQTNVPLGQRRNEIYWNTQRMYFYNMTGQYSFENVPEVTSATHLLTIDQNFLIKKLPIDSLTGGGGTGNYIQNQWATRQAASAWFDSSKTLTSYTNRLLIGDTVLSTAVVGATQLAARIKGHTRMEGTAGDPTLALEGSVSGLTLFTLRNNNAGATGTGMRYLKADGSIGTQVFHRSAGGGDGYVIDVLGGDAHYISRAGAHKFYNSYFGTVNMNIAPSGVVTVANLAGTGTRMVVADDAGNLTTQAIPSGGGGSDGNTFVTSGSFGTGTGNLTLTRNDAATVVISLDGRYLQSEVDGSVSNEIQSLSLNGNELTISGGNTVVLPAGGEGADGNNYLSSLSWNSSTGVLTAMRNGLSDLTVNLDGRYLQSFTEVDGSTSNELQTLSIVGDQLTISNGNTITIPTGSGGSSDGNNYVTSAAFNTGNGNLTLTRNDGGTVIANLDGRYLQSFTELDGSTTNELETLNDVAQRHNATSANLITSATMEANYFRIKNNAEFYTDVKGSSATANRIIEFPDASGTVALQSYIAHSVTNTAGGFSLVNDQTSPGGSKYYGTNLAGTKGWYNLPVGGEGGGTSDFNTEEVTTNDATPTTISNYYPQSGEVGVIEYTVVGIENGANGSVAKVIRFHYFKSSAGDVTIVSTDDNLPVSRSGSLGTANASVEGTMGFVDMKVTGQTATIHWKSSWRVVSKYIVLN